MFSKLWKGTNSTSHTHFPLSLFSIPVKKKKKRTEKLMCARTLAPFHIFNINHQTFAIDGVRMVPVCHTNHPKCLNNKQSPRKSIFIICALEVLTFPRWPKRIFYRAIPIIVYRWFACDVASWRPHWCTGTIKCFSSGS